MIESVFDKYFNDYNFWFKKNKFAYLSELNAIKHFFNFNSKTLEVGIGTGKFALPLEIKNGIDLSFNMLKKIKQVKNLYSICGQAEYLPYLNDCFDNVLLITTICFVNSALDTFKEIRRVLKKNGKIIIGFVDKESELGKIYLKNKDKNKFYKNALFFSTTEIVNFIKKTKFKNIKIIQTLFGDYKLCKNIQNYKNGFGEGNFVVICAEK